MFQGLNKIYFYAPIRMYSVSGRRSAVLQKSEVICDLTLHSCKKLSFPFLQKFKLFFLAKS